MKLICSLCFLLTISVASGFTLIPAVFTPYDELLQIDFTMIPFFSDYLVKEQNISTV
jgi:hypothetical protein